MDRKWIIMGICGVTNGGKTTLTRLLRKILPNVQVISQDSYFLPQSSPKHILIHELNHFNWEVLTSLDMEHMYSDINKLINNEEVITKQLQENNKVDLKSYINLISLEDLQILRNKLNNYNLLVIEGFCIFNYEPIEILCDLKFYLMLDKETCYQRRIARTYDPPDVPGYFEKIVWPEHQKQLQEVQEKCKNIIYLTEDNNHLDIIIKHLLSFI